MGHQPEILTINREKVAAVVSKIDSPGKTLEIDRQTSIDRMPPAMDDTGARKHRVDQGDEMKVLRPLVGDPPGSGRNRQLGQMRADVGAGLAGPHEFDVRYGNYRQTKAFGHLSLSASWR